MSAAEHFVRGFVDLRAFAANTGAGDRPDEEGDTFLSARRMLSLPAGPVSVGLVDLSGRGTVSSLPADEFILLVAGELIVSRAGETMRLAVGESALLPGALSFEWSAASKTQAIVMRCASGAAGAIAPIKVDVTAPLSPSNPPLAELLVGPTPSCRNFSDYRSANGEFIVGTWDSTPYHRRPMDFRHYELMHLLEGAVTFVDGAGRAGTFVANDIVLLEQGARCSWESRVHVKKVYATYRPA